jgi:hypothetical protein
MTDYDDIVKNMELSDIELSDTEDVERSSTGDTKKQLLLSNAGTKKYFQDSKDFCLKSYKYPKFTKNLLKDINGFCKQLRENKVNQARAQFKALPKIIQCMFLHKANFILANKALHNDESYRFAFYVIKLFKTKDMSEQEVYSQYLNMHMLRANYDIANKYFSKQKPSKQKPSKQKPTKENKYELKYQTKDKVDETDPTYIFYTTDYDENPNSRMAITWLVEHGIYGGAKRQEIVNKYIKLKENNELIR